MRRWILLAAPLLLAVLAGSPGTAPAQTRGDSLVVPIVYITKAEEFVPPLSLAEPIITDKGVVGARQALADNNTTGRFLNHRYELIEVIVPEDGDLAATAGELLSEGQRLFVADLHADQLLTLADLPQAADAVIFNARAMDDRLRNDDCRANVFHTMPSRAMKADALAQYLLWKRWSQWFLLYGAQPEDHAFADAVRRAADRFGAEIVEDLEYAYEATARRTDTGHVQIQRQIPALTQDAPDYDVLVVADESDIFGEYLPYRTWAPRPVVGTQGLVPTAWHHAHEQWGGMQMQSRFEDFAGRRMTERDHTAWLGVRSIGEAVTRTGSADAGTIHDYLRSEPFAIGAFKGQALTFRRWNQQMRQPVLLMTPRMLVSASPQEGFLHQRTPLDTLGFDKPESSCALGQD